MVAEGPTAQLHKIFDSKVLSTIIAPTTSDDAFSVVGSIRSVKTVELNTILFLPDADEEVSFPIDYAVNCRLCNRHP